MRSEFEIKSMIERVQEELETLSKENQYDEIISDQVAFRQGVVSALQYALGKDETPVDELLL